MDDYFVTKNMRTDGYHEIHTENCTLKPEEDKVMYLGYFSNCLPALEKANRYYQLVTGCKKCSRKCVGIEEEIILKK